MLQKFEVQRKVVIGRIPTVFSFALTCVCIATSLAVKAQNPEPAAEASSPQPAILSKVKVSPRHDGLAIEIAISAAIVPTADRLTDPDRLVFDFPGCELEGGNRRISVDSGPVQDVRLSQFRVHPPVTRVVVDSKQQVDFEVKPSQNNVVIEIAFPKAASVPPASIQPQPSQPPTSEPAPQQEKPASEIVTRVPSPRVDVYTLQAKAKALNLADLQALEDKAQAGDREAETTLGLAYHTADLLKRDDTTALRLLHKAADQGFMAAEEALGIFCETGIGMAQPAPAEALDWYKKAVQQGSLNAATNIALMYADGRGVTRDPTQALDWFRRAAAGGDSAAQYNLALMYSRGQGAPQDVKESVRWLTAAADQNVIPALMDLALYYMHPPDPAVADVGRAIGYYEKAADLGNARAQAILGNIFANGVQTKRDFEQSVKWYRKAAEQGQPDGQFGLGVRYALGQGVPVDVQEARRWFTAAADQGQVDAQYDLATMCEEGKGAPPDQSLAEHYYQLAADQGMPSAQFRLGRMLAGSSGSRTNRVSAYKWLMLSQDKINQSAPILSNLKKSMNDEEITEAEQQVDQWRVAHRKNQ